MKYLRDSMPFKVSAAFTINGMEDDWTYCNKKATDSDTDTVIHVVGKGTKLGNIFILPSILDSLVGYTFKQDDRHVQVGALVRTIFSELREGCCYGLGFKLENGAGLFLIVSMHMSLVDIQISYVQSEKVPELLVWYQEWLLTINIPDHPVGSKPLDKTPTLH